MTAPDICPVCYEEVPPRAKACPYCGADERSGWREDAFVYDGLDLPEEAWEEPAEEVARSKANEGGVKFSWRYAIISGLLAIALWRLVARWIS